MFRMEGGFAYLPGLAKPLTVDTGELAADEARELEGLVERAGVWNRPRRGPDAPNPAMRDHRSYVLEVQDGARHERLEFSDPVPAELGPLVQALRERVKRAR